MMESADADNRREGRRRLTLPEGEGYVPMFGYDSDGELVLVSPTQKRSGDGDAEVSESSLMSRVGVTRPRSHDLHTAGKLPSARQESAVTGGSTKSPLIPMARVVEKTSDANDNGQVAPELPLEIAEVTPSGHEAQATSVDSSASVAQQGGPDTILQRLDRILSLSEDDQKTADFDGGPEALELTRDNLTGMVINTSASPSIAGSPDESPRVGSEAAPPTDSDIMSAETARGERPRITADDGALQPRLSPERRSTVTGSGALQPRLSPERRSTVTGSRALQPRLSPERRSTVTGSGAFQPRLSPERRSTVTGSGALQPRLNGEWSSTTTDDRLIEPRVSLSLDAPSPEGTTRKSLKERDAELKKALESLRKSLAQPDSNTTYRRRHRDSHSSMTAQSDQIRLTAMQPVDKPQGNVHRLGSWTDQRGSIDESSETWQDGRLEEQVPVGTDDVLVDTDFSGGQQYDDDYHVYPDHGLGRSESAAKDHKGKAPRRAFEKELALEEAVLRQLSPLKRQGLGRLSAREEPKTSVRQLMQDIENAREMTRRLEAGRVRSASNEGSPLVATEKDSATRTTDAPRPVVHVAKVDADWSALVHATKPSEATVCRACGSPVASAARPITRGSTPIKESSLYVRAAEASPGANTIDRKPCTPPLPPTPATDSAQEGTPYIWPAATRVPVIFREDPIVVEESPSKFHPPVPSLPLPTGSTLPHSGAYTASHGEVAPSERPSQVEAVSPMRRPTEDRSTGDHPITVSTVETQTAPIESTRAEVTTESTERPQVSPLETEYVSDKPYHEVLRDRLWRSVAVATGGGNREELVLVDGKIVSYNRETDPPVGHGGNISPGESSPPRQPSIGASKLTRSAKEMARSENREVVSGPPVKPKVTTVRGNNHLVYAYRARVTACDYRWTGGFLRVGLGNSEDILWSEPITTRIRWEVGDVITVVAVARPAPREIVVRLNDNFILARSVTGEFPFPDGEGMDLIPYLSLGSGIASVEFP
ncbi:hypothetical protein FOZ61_009168 [Perkinsus olseni]|nr:hypothetical protein FOZ61_009168 [Perkinsus olseni]